MAGGSSWCCSCINTGHMIGFFDINITPLNFTIFCIWLLAATVHYLGHAYFIQLKEYRWDKFRDFLSSGEGRQVLFEYPYIWRSITALSAFVIFLPFVTPFGFFSLLLGMDVLCLLYSKKKRGWRRPVLTKKAALLVLLAVIVEFLLLRCAAFHHWMLILVATRLFIIGPLTLLINIPASLVKKIMMSAARKKMALYNNLTIVGITGSYGKTTTKEFLSQILSQGKKVIKTPKNINSEIGIAQFVLKTDFSDFDVFVAEMGAYRMGEIAKSCRIAPPNIGILTAINEQHLVLFGGIRSTQKAKYELLRAVPEDGLAIVNGDNPYCREFLDELAAPNQTYGFDDEVDQTYLITNIKNHEDELKMSGKLQGSAFNVSAPVMGTHIAMNIAPCILTAKHLDLSDEQIRAGIAKLKLPDMVLNVYQYGKATIIDDGYNSNPDGFKAALEMLASYPSSKKRIVITRGMLELGKKSDELHEMIGGAIAYTADELVLIKQDFKDPIERGLVGKYQTELLIRDNADALMKYVKDLYDKDVVVLIENSIFPGVYNEVRKEKES